MYASWSLRSIVETHTVLGSLPLRGATNERSRLRLVADAQLGANLGQVDFHGAQPCEQGTGDLLVRRAVGHPLCHQLLDLGGLTRTGGSPGDPCQLLGSLLFPLRGFQAVEQVQGIGHYLPVYTS